MNFVGEVNGVKFYEDFLSKSPKESAKSFLLLDEPIVWIAGGDETEEDFSEIFDLFFDKLYLLVLIGEASNKIRSEALRKSFSNVYSSKGIEEATEYSYLCSEKGTNVLFSPACPSVEKSWEALYAEKVGVLGKLEDEKRKSQE